MGLGYDAEAAITADPAIDAALCGYEYSRLAKLLNIPEHRRFKLPRRKMSILREAPVSTQFDGGNNVGMLTVFHAARHAIEKAQRRGFAVVDVTNSSMSGRSASYVEMIVCWLSAIYWLQWLEGIFLLAAAQLGPSLLVFVLRTARFEQMIPWY
jgi:hypothetical protein